MLGVREEKERINAFKGGNVFSRPGHADDFDPRAVSFDSQPFSNRISVEVAPRKCFVDDRYLSGVYAIGFEKSTSGKHRNGKCLEIAITHVIGEHPVPFMPGPKLVAL